MDSYKALASSYDRLTSDVHYKDAVDFYFEIMRREGVTPRTAADLACGTGSVRLLSFKPEGKGILSAADMVNGRKIAAGMRFESVENA